jgi:CheY-like chemotaxis protein
MPVVNGFEFLEFCQVMGLLVNKQIKIVVVTSSEHELDMQKAREYSVDGYLIKPLTEEKLQEVFLTS